MKYLLSMFFCAAAFCAAAQQVWTPDNGDGTFTNPIMWGDWPDPDIIRVGDDFYMVSTSMHYVPGCPVATSKDLVNWRMAGYAVERYDDDPRYDMQGGTLYLYGAWASTIRYRDGKFYVGFCTPYGWGTEKGHFSICTAERPEGPWERTVFPEYLYDPGLFFDDDGRVYVVHGQGTLYITELSADVKSVKGEPVEIWNRRFKDSATFGGGFGMEGSHMYKIDGKYYITCPAGGTEGWQVCLRSDNIYGPYEHKVIMQDDSSYPPNGLHQGGMVQLENGDWWFIIMQDRGPIGRVPCLVPVTWEDGWPMRGVGGRDVVTYPKPDVGKRAPGAAVAVEPQSRPGAVVALGAARVHAPARVSGRRPDDGAQYADAACAGPLVRGLGRDGGVGPRGWQRGRFRYLRIPLCLCLRAAGGGRAPHSDVQRWR